MNEVLSASKLMKASEVYEQYVEVNGQVRTRREEN